MDHFPEKHLSQNVDYHNPTNQDAEHIPWREINVSHQCFTLTQRNPVLPAHPSQPYFKA